MDRRTRVTTLSQNGDHNIAGSEAKAKTKLASPQQKLRASLSALKKSNSGGGGSGRAGGGGTEYQQRAIVVELSVGESEEECESEGKINSDKL